MKRYTTKELEKLLELHGIRKCEDCGEYEGKRSSGVGGIDADDLGRDGKGRLVHARCAMKRGR